MDCFRQIPMNNDQRIIFLRNIKLASLFVAITSEVQVDAETQLSFIKRQLEPTILSDLFLKIAKPTKKLTLLSTDFGFTLEEVDIYQKVLLKIENMLPSVFDYEIFTIALLFHTKDDELMPIASNFRNLILRVLQNRLLTYYNIVYNTNALYSSVIEDLTKVSQFAIFQ